MELESIPVQSKFHQNWNSNSKFGFPVLLIKPHVKDADLTENGIAQTEEVAEKLKEFNLARIFSSDLKRSKNSAEIIKKVLKLPDDCVTSSAQLNERHYG